MPHKSSTMLDVEYSHKFLSACDGCRKQKVKCDRSKPMCSVCKRRGLTCAYSKPVTRKSEMKRFYDNASESIHLFKCVKEDIRPPKKVARIKSPTQIIPANIVLPVPIPELVTDESGPDSNNSSSSPVLQFHHDFATPGEVIRTPFCSTLSMPKPNMESMVSSYDRRFFCQLQENFGFGNIKLEGGHVVQPSLSTIKERRAGVSILGLDFNPIYSQTESNFGAISSALEIHLINLFFNQVNTFFPLIHRGKFLASLRRPETRPSNFLLNAIYYVACPFLPLNPLYFSGCHYKLAQHYHQEAMTYLEENIINPTITSLQAIILLYNGECSLVEKLNHIQYRMIEQLDLREIEKRVNSAEDREEILNLFWCCYVQDKVCNLTRCRKFALPKSRFKLYLPETFDLPTISDTFPLPGAKHCQLAFVGSVKLAEVIDDVQVILTQYKGQGPEIIFHLVKGFESRLLGIFSQVASHFDVSRIDMHSAMALMLLRLLFHMSHIHLYLFAASMLPKNLLVTVFSLQHRAMESACSITFLTESLQVDFFRFGPLLKANSVLLAFLVHYIAAKTPNPSYAYLGGFGIERAIITNLRNLSFRLGLVLTPSKAESLMLEFITPPSVCPLRSDY
ncbi:Gypsy retrotransposon integrase-like protein 1 [Entomophthora muscae]|uniref:Gypsy retrotransposon integrase-like protein 1 n=1 Tax=Entomophthora muscae TaxID=34485 RepID=A0ACC2U459_9FUNG|nr:Gypsy retrotransposon integrase-like protein 1 [Entomophthora muscae]